MVSNLVILKYAGKQMRTRVVVMAMWVHMYGMSEVMVCTLVVMERQQFVHADLNIGIVHECVTAAC